MKHLFTSLFLAFLFVLPSIQAQNGPKTWEIAKITNGKKHLLKQGQKIGVTWETAEKTTKTKGRLLNIASDSIALSLNHGVAMIAKTDIQEISVKRSLGEKILGFVLIFGGLTLAALFINVLIRNNKQPNYIDKSFEKRNNYLIVIGSLALAALGVRHLVKEPRYAEPFGKHWTIQEKNTPPPNMP